MRNTMIKVSFKEFDNSLIDSDQKICALSNQDKPLVIFSTKEGGFPENESYIYSFKTYDESYKYDREWTSEYVIRSVYLSKEKLVSFLKQYDYFYLLTSFESKKGIITNDNLTYYHNVFEIETKFYNLFPFKNGHLMLDELQDFYVASSVQPYMYNQITKYTSLDNNTSEIPFTNFFWDSMTENELEDSFNLIVENPPLPFYERSFHEYYWGW